MVKRVVAAIAISLTTAGLASAQDHPGAGRVEIGAIPIGSVTFMQTDNATQPKFTNYSVGATAAANLNRWVGLEGDLGFAVGRAQDLSFNGGVLSGQKTPSLWNYSGNVIVNVSGSDRAVVPYVAAGLGGMTIRNTTDAADLGITSNKNYFTTNFGAGLRWFPMQHWGLRGDYRFFMIHTNTDNPSSFFENANNRHAHRLNGSIVLTW